MKRRGSVRGRADAGTGSGPGVERVITHTASPKPFARPVQVSTCDSVKDSANASALVGKDMCLCRMQRDVVMCVKFGAAV